MPTSCYSPDDLRLQRVPSLIVDFRVDQGVFHLLLCTTIWNYNSGNDGVSPLLMILTPLLPAARNFLAIVDLSLESMVLSTTFLDGAGKIETDAELLKVLVGLRKCGLVNLAGGVEKLFPSVAVSHDKIHNGSPFPAHLGLHAAHTVSISRVEWN